MRPDKDVTFLKIAREMATQTTCLRRGVGCVFVSARKHIVATGFNGVPADFPHCNEGHACPGAGAASGTNLRGCYATHAEANALVQCKDAWDIHTCYTTLSPCSDCIKLLLSTSCQRIVFIEEYVHPESRRLWVDVAKREWIKREID